MISAQSLKIVILFTLLTFTFLFSTIPIAFRKILKQQIDQAKKRRIKSALSLLSCFAAGVFLATCLLDLFPEVQSKVGLGFTQQGWYSSFPISEFVLAVGLFFILIVEQTVLTFKESRRQHERTNMSSPVGGDISDVSVASRDFRYRQTSSQEADDLETQRQSDPLLENDQNNLISRSISGESDFLSPSVQLPDENDDAEEMYQDPNSHSPIRSILLLLALSMHSIFEGLAVGLEDEPKEVLQLFAPIALHKSIIAFSLGLNLVQSKLSICNIVASNILFSVTSPLGIAIGIIIVDLSPDNGTANLIDGLLQGLACGTFLYVVFFEILPHEFMRASKYPHRLLKTLLLILGYSTVVAIMFIHPDPISTNCYMKPRH